MTLKRDRRLRCGVAFFFFSVLFVCLTLLCQSECTFCEVLIRFLINEVTSIFNSKITLIEISFTQLNILLRRLINSVVNSIQL